MKLESAEIWIRYKSVDSLIGAIEVPFYIEHEIWDRVDVFQIRVVFGYLSIIVLIKVMEEAGRGKHSLKERHNSREIFSFRGLAMMIARHKSNDFMRV
jgi:hypothetical protein